MHRNALQYQRHHRSHREVPDRDPPASTRSLVTLTARVRSIELTPQGHLSCVLDTTAGRLAAFSDAAGLHQRELRVGRTIRVALMRLRLRRTTDDRVRHWQLLGCSGADEPAARPQTADRDGSLA